MIPATLFGALAIAIAVILNQAGAPEAVNAAASIAFGAGGWLGFMLGRGVPVSINR